MCVPFWSYHEDGVGTESGWNIVSPSDETLVHLSDTFQPRNDRLLGLQDITKVVIDLIQAVEPGGELRRGRTVVCIAVRRRPEKSVCVKYVFIKRAVCYSRRPT